MPRHQLERLRAKLGRSRCVETMDLWDQHQHLERTGMFRFTPPVHLWLAMAEALREHAEEGGIEARQARYRRSWQRLVDGMRQMGFRTLAIEQRSK